MTRATATAHPGLETIFFGCGDFARGREATLEISQSRGAWQAKPAFQDLT